MKKRVRQVGKWVKKLPFRKRRVLFHTVHVAAHVVMWTALASIFTQLAYPSDRALPLTRLDGVEVGLADKQTVMKELDKLAGTAELTVMTPNKERRVQWASIGITIDREASAEVVLQYEWWERLVPFSMVARMTQRQHTPLVIVDKDRLRGFVEQIVLEDRAFAKEASIAVVDGEIQVDEAKAGYIFEKDRVEQRLLGASFASGKKVVLEPNIVPTVRDREAVMLATLKAERVLERQLTIEFAGETFTPGRTTVGSWLKVEEDTKTKQLELRFDRKKLQAYLGDINKEHASPPGTTHVTLLDGQEVARVAAKEGRAMNIGTATKTIEAALLGTDPAPVVAIPVEPIAPEVSYKRTYSRASSGLQALIEDWERTTYGTYGIVVREIGGSNRYAQWQPDKPFVTSSTYKMFLAYTVLTKMEEGKVKGDQRTDMGWTVDECITEMIVNSTNACAISIQNLIGWQRVDDMLHAAGFKDTHLNNQGGGEKYTTVRDESNFLLRLNAGTLMGKDSTERLLGLMKRQIWRGGIPQGVPYGTVVANKVGFYDGWVHDVAIVYGPKSTYILAILSRGGSDPGFANLSEKVYNFFNQ